MLKNIYRLPRLNKNVIYYELTKKNALFCSQKNRKVQMKQSIYKFQSLNFMQRVKFL